MKTKLEMAHEYAIALINSDCEMQFDKFIQLCWNYADAMQAEADKRKPSEFPNVLRGACGEIVAVKVDDKEWQPDWSQSPKNTTHWGMELGSAYWLKDEGDHLFYKIGEAPSFGYTGDWRNSLRKRPK